MFAIITAQQAHRPRAGGGERDGHDRQEQHGKSQLVQGVAVFELGHVLCYARADDIAAVHEMPPSFWKAAWWSAGSPLEWSEAMSAIGAKT
jgi:hypothetical protein